jgi:hypothetical protein
MSVPDGGLERLTPRSLGRGRRTRLIADLEQGRYCTA